MKNVNVILLTLIVTLMAALPGVFSIALAAEPAWVLLDENRESKFFFDTNSPVKVQGGIERVMARVVYTEKGKAEALELLQPASAYEGLVESRYVYSLDCAKTKSKLMQVNHLRTDGTVLKSFDLAALTPWEDIPSKARLMLIFSKACAP